MINRNIFIYIIIAFCLLKPAFVFSQTPLNIAPNFSVVDARGNYHDLYSYLNNNKYVLLDFFYNECLVCQTHIPEVNDAYIKFGCNTQDVFFLGINLDNTDGEVIAFENEYAIHYPNVSGVDGGGNNIVELYQVIAFPTIILIAPDKSIPKQDMWPLTAVNIIDETMSVGLDTAACPSLFVNNIHHNDEFFIYPNPANDFINIANTSNFPHLFLTVYDFTGRIVHTQALKEKSKERIIVNNLTSGLYLFQIKSASNLILNEKIIIQ